MPNRVSILGIPFDQGTRGEALARIYAMCGEARNHRVVTPNSEIVYAAQSDPELARVLRESDYVAPDGIGVVLASRLLKTPLSEKVAGIELGEGLLARAAQGGERVFLLGAKPGVAQAAADRLCAIYPGLVIAGVMDGYFEDDRLAVDAVNAANVDILFVCLGAPKQEYFMAKNQDRLNVRVMLGLGGSLDVYAGVARRAPEIWVKLGLEWLYRLCKQPSRIGRMLALPKFLWRVARSRGKEGSK